MLLGLNAVLIVARSAFMVYWFTNVFGADSRLECSAHYRGVMLLYRP